MKAVLKTVTKRIFRMQLPRLPRPLWLRVLALPLLMVTLPGQLLAEEIQYDWQGVERIVAVGDLHGDYDNYLQVLREAGVVNRRGKWSAGETHLVQVGDVPDRGPDTDRIMRHLMGLEKQARRAGGRVHVLIGNHEALNIIGDLRYVDPGEYEALKSRSAKRLRDDYYDRVVEYLRSQAERPTIDGAFREEWNEKHPLGFVEHRQIWHPEGEFGRWVLGHNAVIRINNILFMHAGLGRPYLGLGIAELNDRIRNELRNPGVIDPDAERLIQSEEGPLWYRGFARPAGPEEAEHLAAVLETYDVERVVVGHTPDYGLVKPHFDSRVIAIDSGISSSYGGFRASLIIEGQALTAVQRGERIPIPDSEEGLLEYYRQIQAIDPEARNLKVLIYRLENPSEILDESEVESGPAEDGPGEDPAEATVTDSAP